MAKSTEPVVDKPWYEKYPIFKDAIFACLDCNTVYDPPPTPAVCGDCGEDLIVAVPPQVVPTQKTVKVCVQCGTESQKTTADLQGGAKLYYCPVCGSTGGVLEVTVPLTEVETQVIMDRNNERARVRAQAEAISNVKSGA